MSYGQANVDTIQSSTAGVPPQFNDGGSAEIGRLCRAWVNYNAVSKTILASFNVSSVTYSSTGNYTVNFTNAMPDANYCVTGSCQVPNNDVSALSLCGRYNTTPLTTSLQVAARSDGGTVLDSPYTSVAIFR